MNDQSIKDRLKNLGRKEGKNFDELLMRYTIERFLYRLSVSPHREHFVEKEKHWRAFLQRINVPINISFAEIIQELTVFLLPIHNSCIEQTPFHYRWDTTAWR